MKTKVKTCQIVIEDEITARIVGLDEETKNDLDRRLAIFVPSAVFSQRYRLGLWDGRIHFFRKGSGRTSFLLLEDVLEFLLERGWTATVEDRRPPLDIEIPDFHDHTFADAGIVWPEWHEKAGEPVVLRDYQVEAVRTLSRCSAGVLEFATGSGKTLIIASLAWMVAPQARVLVIEPNRNLVDQTRRYLDVLGLDSGAVYEGCHEVDRRVAVSTWQTMHAMARRGSPELERLVDGVGAVIVDEVHTARATVLRSIMTDTLRHVPLRWGLTGTIPRDKVDGTTIRSSVGPVVGRLRNPDLIERGVLAQCRVVVHRIPARWHFDNWHEEKDWVASDPGLLGIVAEIVQQFPESGNTLILVDRIVTGKTLSKLLGGVPFVSGSMDAGKRQKIYEILGSGQQEMVIATYGVAAVGIDVPRIFNLVLYDAGKSAIRVLQSVGRGIRKAKDKSRVTVHDILPQSKRYLRLYAERRRLYRENEFPIEDRTIPLGFDDEA